MGARAQFVDVCGTWTDGCMLLRVDGVLKVRTCDVIEMDRTRLMTIGQFHVSWFDRI